MDLQLSNFDEPSETRHFEKGRFELYRVGPVTVGRATYEPGWRWSEHVAPTVGTASCQVEHVGLVLSGQAVAIGTDTINAFVACGTARSPPSLPQRIVRSLKPSQRRVRPPPPPGSRRP